ncbi:tetratricopeptide repeat protein [Marinobacter sp. 1Y8]
MKLFNRNGKKAQRLHEQGQQLSDGGRDEEAVEAYLKAIELDPNKSESFYNVGLIYKYQGAWEKSLEYNAKAYELNPEDESARWNLAIAATALREWKIARRAWSDNGIELEGEAGPINMNFGITPVRLNPEISGEVVWATRVDPVRARIDSIPYKESGFMHGDVVLHDGGRSWVQEDWRAGIPSFQCLREI